MEVCESEYRQVGGTDDDEEIQARADGVGEHVLLCCTDAGGRLPFIARGRPTRDAGLHSGGEDTCS